MNLKIEKKVPIWERSSGRYGEMRRQLSKMVPGDSVFSPDWKTTQRICNTLIKHFGPRRAVIRKCENGWRIWLKPNQHDLPPNCESPHKAKQTRILNEIDSHLRQP